MHLHITYLEDVTCYHVSCLFSGCVFFSGFMKGLESERILDVSIIDLQTEQR
jgi:hypothetical protein